MRDILLRFWVEVSGRVMGPMKFRLVLQPGTAIFFAIRAGLHDARMRQTPYLWAMLVGARGRGDLLREAWRDVGRVFVLGIVIDAIYQWRVFGRFYLLDAVVIAFLLALVPYVLARGPITRLIRRFRPPANPEA